jgi:thiamine biosynthesis lipoprotein
MRSVGWSHVHLDTSARTIEFAVSGMRLDFGGIAKGYAADEALAVLRSMGLTRAFIEFGGETAASDPPPGESGWPVSVGGTSRHVALANSALSTSGDAEQFIEIDGLRYSHVVDPRTGSALTSRVSATVSAPSALMADALSTATTVLDSVPTVTLIHAHPGARLVSRTGWTAASAVAQEPCTFTPPPPRARGSGE